jgi:hypothetical protein
LTPIFEFDIPPLLQFDISCWYDSFHNLLFFVSNLYLNHVVSLTRAK